MKHKRVCPLDRYGHLTVMRRTGKKDSCGNIVWLCRCDCGNYVEKTTHYLHRDEMVQSCGCLKGEGKVKHGDKRRHGKASRLYSIWRGMLWRCNPKNKDERSYAARGISVCDEWLNYTAFKAWAVENGYADNLSIDRIDYNGDYVPENCRWVTPEGQANNKSNNHLITYNGKTMTLAEWAMVLGINYSTLRSRINRQHLSPEQAFCTNTSAKRDAKTGRFIGGYELNGEGR